MKIIKGIMILFSISLLISCDSKKLAFQSYYNHIHEIEKLDSSLINHFPIKFNIRNAYFFYSSAGSQESEIIEKSLHLLVVNDAILINQFKERYDKRNLTQIDPDDSCLLIIPWLSKLYNDEKEFLQYSDSIKTFCDNYSLPVPSFQFENDFFSIHSNRLTKDFKVFIIDAKPKKLIDNIKYNGNYGIPIDWKSGYSKGVAFNEKRNAIIFWILIW